MVSIVILSCSGGYTQAFGSEPDALPSGYVIKFERKGGYFGKHDAFWIYPDGKVFNSIGKTSKIPSDLVAKWMKAISSAKIPVLKKRTSIQSLCMDCYIYVITFYDKDETKVLSSLATDTYPINKDGNISLINIGRIRDTLMNLSWK